MQREKLRNRAIAQQIGVAGDALAIPDVQRGSLHRDSMCLLPFRPYGYGCGTGTHFNSRLRRTSLKEIYITSRRAFVGSKIIIKISIDEWTKGALPSLEGQPVENRCHAIRGIFLIQIDLQALFYPGTLGGVALDDRVAVTFRMGTQPRLEFLFFHKIRLLPMFLYQERRRSNRRCLLRPAW